MASQSVTVELPEAVYNWIKQAAGRSRRPVDKVLSEAVTAVASVIEVAPASLRSALAQLAYLNDAAMWQAGRSSMPVEHRERLALLHDLQQRRPLSPEERSEEQALLQLYQETILVRAQAAVLLKQRGYDVADPGQFAPLA
jgi:hypothetical protein